MQSLTIPDPSDLTESTSATDSDTAAQDALCARGEIPAHIAIIMDGNGRWAEARGHQRVFGHHEGVESVRDIAEACAQLGVSYLTLYTFSTENWRRPTEEVNALMQLLIQAVEQERATLQENNIRLQVVGDLDALPDESRAAVARMAEETSANSRMTLSLALSYSGRWELLQAAQRLAEAVQAGDLAPDAIDEALLEGHLATAGMPDPDLLIRTGGEQRISNFLLWQIAYAELYFCDDFWPAFRRPLLYDAIRDFQDRDRRFGGVHQ